MHDLLFFLLVICVFGADRFQTLVEYLSQAAKGNDVRGSMCGGDAAPFIICIDRSIVCNTGVAGFVIAFAHSMTEQPDQPGQPRTLDLILVTYNTSSALADLFRDARNKAYGIGCHEYGGARDRPCYVGSLVHVAICVAGELSAKLSKHVSPDCYMCGIVHSMLVSS